MSGAEYCDGCAWLRFEEPVNRYDVHRALCCDADKPVLGARRVVATAGVCRPWRIQRPAWCRGKEEKQMKVRIWQSPNIEFMFSDSERLEERGHSLQRLPFQEYSCVFDGALWAFHCEDVYRAFNMRNKPAGYTGHSLSVGDVVEIVENAPIQPDGSEDAPGLYFCDSIGFKPCAWA